MSVKSLSILSPGAPVSPPNASDEMPSLIDRFLLEQQELTAVGRFARVHEAGDVPAQARYYRELIPLTAPGPGEQYGFEVDLDSCSGCKCCVTACHNLNGLDEDETWRGVGLLVGGSVALPALQHVTTACHHCVEPACMEGCPVLAYEKDPVTGIVRHLDDQCIGCQYCILKCPYDVPKYNKKKGIVRKCDMCSDRLGSGEAPACVQACPTQAIRIRIVDKQKVVEDSEARLFLPGAPDPDYTLPTTNYVTGRPLPRNMLPADYYQVAPEHAHLPLVVMLVLTQLSVGAFAVEQVLLWAADETALAALRPLHAAVALGLGMLALGASTLHLGRPLYAFRAIVGLRTSWLSREILTFGLFAGLAFAYAATSWLPVPFIGPAARSALGSAVAGIGLAGVFCSVMIYHDTRRVFWRFQYTGTKFFLSTLLLGVATTLITALTGTLWSDQLSVHTALRGWGQSACSVMAAVSFVKITFAAFTFRHLRDRRHTPMKRTALLGTGPLFRPVMARLALGLVGGVMLPLLARQALSSSTADPTAIAVLIVAAFVMTLGAELLERYLFFTAVVAPKMPGGLGA